MQATIVFIWLWRTFQFWATGANTQSMDGYPRFILLYAPNDEIPEPGTPEFAAMEWSDVRDYELPTGDGYTRGGIELAGAVLSDGTGSLLTMRKEWYMPIAWENATFEATHLAIVAPWQTPWDRDEDSSVMAVIDLGGVQAGDGGTFGFEWDDEILFELELNYA